MGGPGISVVLFPSSDGGSVLTVVGTEDSEGEDEGDGVVIFVIFPAPDGAIVGTRELLFDDS